MLYQPNGLWNMSKMFYKISRLRRCHTPRGAPACQGVDQGQKHHQNFTVNATSQNLEMVLLYRSKHYVDEPRHRNGHLPKISSKERGIEEMSSPSVVYAHLALFERNIPAPLFFVIYYSALLSQGGCRRVEIYQESSSSGFYRVRYVAK